MKEKVKRMSTFAICLGLVCFFLTGTGLAGTTATTVVELGDCSPGGPNRVITVPENIVTRAMGELLVSNFFMTVTLGSGFEFATGTLPVTGDLALTTAGGGAVTISIFNGGDGDTSVDYLVAIDDSFTSFPTFTLTTTDWTVRDVNNLLAGGGIVPITVETRDLSTGISIDVGTDTVSWLNIAGPGCLSPLSPRQIVLTKAVADVDAGTLSIFGDNFGPSPRVFLGTVLGTLEELGVNSSTPTFIEAALTPKDPGTFLVVVSTDPRNNDMFAMDVTIGAVGPQGATGQPGADGAAGVLGFYTRTATFDFDPCCSVFSGSVSCDPGDIATGGGWEYPSDIPGLEATWPVTQSRSEGSDAWFVEVTRQGGAPDPNQPMTMNVVCADVTP